jgi:hypothetical protein
MVIVPPGRIERVLSSRALRGAAAAGVLAAVISGGMFFTKGSTAPTPPVAPRWEVDVASAGTRPVRALVFGSEAGVHLVRVPPAGASPSERRTIITRVALGDVYMVSLGRSPLAVRTESPPSIRGMSFTATARFVKLYQRPDATGIRTGWR